MKTIRWKVALGLLCLAPAQLSLANLVVYPNKGQSSSQQQKDTKECYSWAKKQTGVDPQTGQGVPTDTPDMKGGRARGAARGALGGAVVGGITGDAGTGAAIGAAGGAMGGGMRQRQAKQQAGQMQQQGAVMEFQKAQATCLQGRGYSVN